MKNCPRCHLPYPDDFSICPKDGTVLQYLQEWQPGEVVREKYRIIQKIGQGGMGAVYKAEHLVFEELRALKVLMPQFAHDEAVVRFLQQEARITRRLSHPNAVRVEDVDRAEDGRLFIAMEYVEGKSLREVIKQSGRLSALRVIEIARQLCSGLDSAHSLGMIHRDIKPDNVLLVRQPDDRDLIKILDFGIAKIKESAKERGKEATGITMTKTGFVVGTPQYMSPEQARGTPGDRLDGRSDLYSVGVLLYEALTGDLPFHADTPLGYILHHVNTLPRSPMNLHPDFLLPESVVSIVMKALEKDPAARFQSAREMILALTAAAEAFEKDTVIKKIYTGQAKKPDLSVVSKPPPAPASEEKGSERQVPPPAPVAPVAVQSPPQDAISSPPLSAPWETTETMGGRQPIILSLRHRVEKILTQVGRKRLWMSTAALLIVVSIVLGVWVSSRRPPAVTLTPEPGQGTSSKVAEPAKQPSQSPPGAEPQTQTHAPASAPPELQRETTTPPRESAATPQVIKPKPAQNLSRRPQGLSPDEVAALRDKLATGSLYMDHGNYDLAVQTFDQALKIDPKNAQARDGLRKARQLLDILTKKGKE